VKGMKEESRVKNVECYPVLRDLYVRERTLENFRIGVI